MDTRVLVAIGLAIVASSALAQTGPAPPVVTAGFSGERYLAARTAISLTVNPMSGGAFAILIGTTDVTALFDRRGDQLVYRADVLPLPSGETDVSVYSVEGGAWSEIGRFPLRVLTALGFTKSTVVPTASVNNKGQLAERRSSGQPASERPTFQDLQLATGFQTSQTRSDWVFESRASAVGVTNRREALRFGDRGDRAPRFDLSDYLVRVQRGGAKLSLGNVVLGSNRHLINGFGSRGATLDLTSPVVSLAVGGVAGSPAVGWDDPLGFTRPAHRVLGGTLGVELRPQRPGAVHLDVTVVDGSLLPRAGFGQNAVTDAERSTGVGLQLSASSPQQRLRLVGGISESRFVNPHDPLIDPTQQTKPAVSTRKTARYLEATSVLLQNAMLARRIATSLTTGWRYERVDPLYRSVAAFTRADLLANSFDATGMLGPVSIQGTYSLSRDNLGNVPSLLTTNTNFATSQVMVPIGALFHTSARWVPTASYGFNQTHQFGVGVPLNGGFTAANLPDQVGTLNDVSLQWQGIRWRVLYRFNDSFQDTRQPGREAADLQVSTNAVSLGLTPSRVIDVSVDLSSERQHNLERNVHGTVERLGLTANWRPSVGTGVVSSWSSSRNADAPLTERAGNNEVRVELSRSLALGRVAQQGARAQVFVRYARQSAHTDFLTSDITRPPIAQAIWSVASGLNFLVF